MRKLSRKMVSLALAGLTSLATPTSVVAQAAEFPNKPVTLIVPFQAGISVDILLRGIAEVAGQHLGQPVVIDNKAGGSATLGPAHMASNAKPDGYTIAQIPMPVLRVPHLQKVTYDPLKDFTWIIQLGGYTIGVVVPTASEFKTFKHVIAFAKANPGKLTYTTPGPSTLNSIAMELVARKEGTTLAHVPGKGGGEAMAAILGGHVMVNVEFDGLGTNGGIGRPAPACAPEQEAKHEVARRANACRARLRLGFQRALRTRRAEGHGSGSGQEAARCLQEGLR